LIAAVTILFGVSATSALSAEWKVLEIDCGSKPLTGDKKCAKDLSVGSELEIIVNPATQKVQITVSRNSGKYFDNVSIIPEKCSIVDENNWTCSDDIPSVKMFKKYGMRHGHYYYELTGGAPPDYFTSSISSWRYWAYWLGIMKLQTAEAYD
jgi:hypothetical protein